MLVKWTSPIAFRCLPGLPKSFEEFLSTFLLTLTSYSLLMLSTTRAHAGSLGVHTRWFLDEDFAHLFSFLLKRSGKMTMWEDW